MAAVPSACGWRGGKLASLAKTESERQFTKQLQKIQDRRCDTINRVEIISDAQADELRRQLPAPSNLIFAIGIETGLRISDILNLKISDIKNPMSIKISRVHQVRSFIITHELLAALHAHARGKPAGHYIFAGRSYKRHIHMHRTTYHRHIKRAVAGLDFSASAHSTRKRHPLPS